MARGDGSSASTDLALPCLKIGCDQSHAPASCRIHSRPLLAVPLNGCHAFFILASRSTCQERVPALQRAIVTAIASTIGLTSSVPATRLLNEKCLYFTPNRPARFRKPKSTLLHAFVAQSIARGVWALTTRRFLDGRPTPVFALYTRFSCYAGSKSSRPFGQNQLSFHNVSSWVEETILFREAPSELP